MQAKDIMTTGMIASIGPDGTIEAAARKMLGRRISGLPVLNAEGRLVGLITEGDLLRRVELGTQTRRSRWIALLTSSGRIAEEYAHAHGGKVADVMTTDIVTATPETSVEDIVALMESNHIKRVPIVAEGRLVGLISRSDLVRALLDCCPKADGRPHDDEEIHDAVLAAFDREAWAPRIGIRPEVTDGVVTLCGVIFDERERAALRIAAESVPGVKAVHDQLSWMDPVSGFALPPPVGG